MAVAAQTPPMGWRSWNLYQGNVNQTLMEETMRGVAQRRHPHYSGGSLSLCDLGYCDVGLDDNWQQCNSPLAAEGMKYHDETGASIVNEITFPNLSAMVTLAHELKLTAGWYHNNCICSDHCKAESTCELQIQQDAKKTAELQFDGVKLDGCGGQRNLTMWKHYLNLYSPNKTIVMENCHWGQGEPPSRDNCPYHFYRSSLDIYPTYKSVVYNLHSVERYRSQNLSFPGCWAYPDMLQVGVHNEQFPGLTTAETRTHFGAWAIVSSPLILSHDVNNDTITGMIWDVIANLEVLEVNQNYVGDSGGRYWKSSDTISMGDLELTSGEITSMRAISITEYYSKPISGDRVAVLAVNHGNATRKVTLAFRDMPGVSCDPCQVRDIWNHRTIGILTGEVSTTLESHDSAFFVISEVSAKTIVELQSSFISTAAVSALVLIFSLRRLQQLWFGRCFKDHRHTS